ncbi:MAG: hypothetical protein JKY68_05400 [Rhodospirillales bacterium]|nr:hypothetical protein [Rhodospirillales bacterium]
MANDAPYVLHAVAFPTPLPETVGPEKIPRAGLSQGHFKELVGVEVEITGANGTTRMAVVSCTEKPRAKAPGIDRMPFTLTLRGPDTVVLDGSHFDFQHPVLGTIPYLMLSRVIRYPDEPQAAVYEITFN